MARVFTRLRQSVITINATGMLLKHDKRYYNMLHITKAVITIHAVYTLVAIDERGAPEAEN